MVLNTPFNILGYTLRTPEEAHVRFKQIISQMISRKDNSISREKKEIILCNLIEKLEVEKDQKNDGDCTSQNIYSIIQQVYGSLPSAKYGYNIQVTNTSRTISTISITQPGAEIWKLLRLCYLQDNDFKELLNKDNPQAITVSQMNKTFLLEGNTRLLYQYLLGESEILVQSYHIQNNSLLQNEILSSCMEMSDVVKSLLNYSSVLSLEQSIYNHVIREVNLLTNKKPILVNKKKILATKDLTFAQLVDLEKKTSIDELLSHPSLSEVIKMFMPNSYEAPVLREYDPQSLTPTQYGIEKSKYDKLSKSYEWKNPSNSYIKKGDLFTLDQVPIIVINCPTDLFKRKFICVGHARAKYLMEKYPEKAIPAFSIKCMDNNYVSQLGHMADYLNSQGVKSALNIPILKD